MKQLLLICFPLFLAISGSAQVEYNHIVAKVLMAQPVQKIFEGKKVYMILENEILNSENCTPSMIQLDRPVIFWKYSEEYRDGRVMIEPTDCIAFLKIEILDRNGYTVLVQDLNTGRNIFVQKY